MQQNYNNTAPHNSTELT